MYLLIRGLIVSVASTGVSFMLVLFDDVICDDYDKLVRTEKVLIFTDSVGVRGFW